MVILINMMNMFCWTVRFAHDHVITVIEEEETTNKHTARTTLISWILPQEGSSLIIYCWWFSNLYTTKLFFWKFATQFDMNHNRFIACLLRTLSPIISVYSVEHLVSRRAKCLKWRSVRSIIGAIEMRGTSSHNPRCGSATVYRFQEKFKVLKITHRWGCKRKYSCIKMHLDNAACPVPIDVHV